MIVAFPSDFNPFKSIHHSPSPSHTSLSPYISLSNKQSNPPTRHFPLSFLPSIQFDSGTNFSKKLSFRGIHAFSFFSFFFVTTNPSRSCGYEHVATSSSHVFIMQNHGSDCGIITCSGTNRHFPQNGF